MGFFVLLGILAGGAPSAPVARPDTTGLVSSPAHRGANRLHDLAEALRGLSPEDRARLVDMLQSGDK